MSTIRLNISPFCHITCRMVLSELYLQTASRRELPMIHKKAERKSCPFCFARHSFLPFLMCIADNTKYPFFRITSRFLSGEAIHSRMVLSELNLHTAFRRKLPMIHKKAERKCCPFCFACHFFLPFFVSLPALSVR